MKYLIVYLLGILLILSSCAPKKKEKKNNGIASIENEEEVNYGKFGIVARESFYNLQEKDTSVFNFKGDFFRIDIGDLLNDNNKYSLLSYFTTDSTGMVILSKNTGNGWINLYEKELEIYRHLNNFEYLRYEDFTGDGLNEVLIPYNLAPSHENFNYYCLTLKGNKMQTIPGFEELTHPEFDKRNMTIQTLHGGGIGNYFASEYKLENAQLVEIVKVKSSTAPFEESEDGFVQIIETFRVKNGDSNLVKVDSIVGLNHKLPPFWEIYFNNLEEHNIN